MPSKRRTILIDVIMVSPNGTTRTNLKATMAAGNGIAPLSVTAESNPNATR